MIKLIALDLDGTTLNSKGEISELNRKAIRRAEDLGVLVTIATGRRFRDARPIAIELDLNAPLISHNGALLKYADSFTTVHSSILPTETTLDVIDIGRTFGGDPLVSIDPDGIGSLLYDRVSDSNLPLKKYLHWAENLHGSEAGRQGVEHVESLNDAIHGEKVVHISFSGNCGSMSELELVLKKDLTKEVNILSTVYPVLDFTLIDVLPPDTSKGHAVEMIAALNGIERNEVMAIGDNLNDLQMLEYAGVPIVMGNAEPGLRTMPDFYTTLTNDENGVAAAIDRFIFSDQEKT